MHFKRNTFIPTYFSIEICITLYCRLLLVINDYITQKYYKVKNIYI